MGIRAKQLLDSTFTSTTVGTKFAAQSIAGSKIVNGDVDTTQLADAGVTEAKLNSSVAGNGISGGGGSKLAVALDTTTGGGESGLAVGANGLGLGSAAAGAGLTGGAGAALAVGGGTGLTANANDVALDTGATVDYSSDTPVITFGNETTNEGLFVSGTPQDANHVPNKAYVDAQVSGLLWKDPVSTPKLLGNVDVINLVGTAAASVIEGLSVEGDSYVVGTADGSGALTTAAVGDIWQYVSASWTKIATGAGGFVPDGTYATLNTTTALLSPYTDSQDEGYRVRYNGSDNDPTDGGSADFFAPTGGDAYVVDGSGASDEGDMIEWSGSAFVTIETASGGFVADGVRAVLGLTPAGVLIAPYTEATDDGKIVDFTGASNTGADTGDAVDKASVLAQDSGHIGFNDNNAYVFEGAVPSGSWVQWNGGGQVNAGAGMTKSGNTLDVIGGNGVTVAADLVSVDVDSETGGNIQPANLTTNGVGVDINAIAGTGIEADGSANLRLATQGTGIGGGNGSTLSFDATAADGNGLTGSGAVLAVDSDTETGTPILGVNVTANGVGIDVSALDGAGLELTPSGTTLRIAGAAAGGGLTGGAGSSLAVGAGNGVTVNANDVAVNPAQLITGGNAEVDGDQLDIDWTPAVYTPDPGPAEVSDANHLTAHLKGIDDALGAAGGTQRQESITTEVITTDVAITDTLNNTPTSNAAVKVFLNGILQTQGAGADYTVSGTTITWLAASGTAVDMDTSDILIAVYAS